MKGEVVDLLQDLENPGEPDDVLNAWMVVLSRLSRVHSLCLGHGPPMTEVRWHAKLGESRDFGDR